ncbi:MAG TPA: hypothetical protein PL048_10460 [Leptospiraceae bacterium]|nr:hypothetical protein [Leptospiraceae bacterium]HMZ59189.1 hypothetical protein [Leptospiraceae bacterium]HNF14007.1 hypothetical protein [Leptospiraceae bacterium]HNH07924.1 hypothetical protein [Leptospiraceae bacterium]HNI98275.1 hypothetical protein [Leptospiraceae bacterium]
MTEAKKGRCIKCNLFFYVHDHHILPKSRFGNEGETVRLCPNCHTHFHEYSRINTRNPEDREEALKIWTIWLRTISVTVSIIIASIIINYLR